MLELLIIQKSYPQPASRRKNNYNDFWRLFAFLGWDRGTA